jgi:glycolate oxidase FAD binding subunit
VSKLMIGAMGTLGILGDMTARLLPLPERVDAMLFSFDDLEKAGAFADRVLNTRLLPTSLELLNNKAFELTACPEIKMPAGGWCVAVGLEGFDEEVAREISDLAEMAKMEKVTDLAELGRDGADAFWKKLSDFSVSPLAGTKTLIKFKGTFLISRYVEVLSAWTEAASDRSCAMTASAGVGVAYAHMHADPDDGWDGPAKIGASFREAAALHGGSLVVESAPPALKLKLDPWGDTRSDFTLMKKIKANLDPLGVLNPGRYLGGL